MRMLVSVLALVLWQTALADDCVDCESKTGKIDEFQRELTLEGDLDEAQRERMLEIADRCPVHQTLHSEVKVRTKLV